MENTDEIQNSLEQMPLHVIAVLTELGGLYRKTNPYWNTEEMSKFAKDNALSVLVFWENELGMDAPVSCSKVVSMWYKKTSTAQKIRQEFLNSLSEVYVENNHDVLDFLLNLVTTNVANKQESYEKLEEIYKDNTRQLANLNLEKLKGLHNTNPYVFDGWANDIYHLNLQQKAIEELFSSYPRNNEELATPSLEAARLVKSEARKQTGKNINDLEEAEKADCVWVEVLKEGDYTLVGRLASNATDADTDSDVWYLIEKGKDDPSHIGDYNHYNQAILAFNNISKLKGFLK